MGILDSNYNVIVKYTYDSYGNILSVVDNDSNSITDTNHIGHINPFRYRSYYYDKEINLYYLNSRYYNPVWGRFINADSMLTQTNNLLGNNLYIYCNNNPINGFDSNGKFFKSISKALKGVSRAIKKVVNTTVRIVVNGCAEIASKFGLTNSADLLQKSLSDKPVNVNYGNDSDIAKSIKESSSFVSKIEGIVASSPNKKFNNDSTPIHFDKKNLDLMLGLQNATMYVSGDISNGNGKLSITIEDRYDFDNQDYSGSYANKFIDTINNFAWLAQGMGAINPYNIKVSFDYYVE